MKIIEPSATIIEDELSQLSIYQRIDTCGAVCYQRNPKPTDEEAQEFCRKMVKSGHFATLEMAVVHLVMPVCEATSMFLVSKYISHHYNNGWVVLSGSIRAFSEFLLTDKDDMLLSVRSFLWGEYPALFSCPHYREYPLVRFAEPHEIPWQHQHVAVRFVVNRAVSHELVRHRPCSFLQESMRFCRYSDDVTFIEPLWTSKGEWLRNEWLKDMAHDEERYKFRLLHKLTPQEAREKLPHSTKTELIVYANLPQWKHIFSLRDSKAADPEMQRVMKPLHQEFKVKYPEAFSC